MLNVVLSNHPRPPHIIYSHRIARAPVMAEVDQIIRERLITHESVVGGTPSIINTTKRFFQFSEAVQSQDTPSILAYNQLLTEVSRYEFDLQSGAVVQNTCTREMEQYAKIEAEVEDDISKTQRDIEKLKSTLQQERLRRQQKEEYETISRIINTHRPRKQLQKEIAELETRLESLNADAKEASEKVEVRQKQLHLFLSSMQELSSLWKEMEEDSNGSENGGGGGGGMAGEQGTGKGSGVGGFNDDMEDDEDEDEDDERRYHRGANDEEEDVVMGDGEEEEEEEEGEEEVEEEVGEDGEILE